jgi:adenylate kinase
MNEKPDRAAWIKGGGAVCSGQPHQTDHPWRLALLGAPGVGKGTQAQLLSSHLGSCHLSTGDIFRAAKGLQPAEVSPALCTALDCMRRGELVSDETVLGLVHERAHCLHCGGGFLLDGFPRTLIQAGKLEKLMQEQNLAMDAVVNYEMEQDAIVERLAGRLVCPGCKAGYHRTGMPPKVEGICDRCGQTLCQREDDRPEAVRVRMQAYEASAQPLIDFYQQRGLLVRVPATGSAEEILQRTVAALEARRQAAAAAPSAPPKRAKGRKTGPSKTEFLNA